MSAYLNYIAGKVLECSRRELTKRDKPPPNSNSVREYSCTCLIATTWHVETSHIATIGLQLICDIL
jgi:hypothetical protein